MALCCVSSKSPSRVRDGDEGVARRNVRERIIFLIKATPIQPKKLKFRKFRFLRPDDLGADPKNQNFEISDFWGTWDRQKDQKGRKFENSDFWACYPALKTKKAKNQKKRQGECATTPLLPPHPHSVQYLHHLHIPTSPTVLNTLCPSSLPSPTSPTIQHCT